MSNLLEDRLGEKYGKKRGIERKQLEKHKKTVKFSELEKAVFDEDDFERDYDEIDLTEARQYERNKLKRSIASRAGKAVLVLLISYTVFLTYGIAITDYIYDERGNVVPLVMSVDDIERKREFEDFSAYYYSIRELYEKILLLDDILAGADDSTDYVSLSSEYEQLLDTVSYIVIQLEAYSPASAYRQTYEMMTELIKTDIAVYLQNISAALAKNDSDKWQKAVIDRENVLVKFSKVTGNLLSIGETVKGVSIADISGWNARDIITAERDQNVQQQ